MTSPRKNHGWMRACIALLAATLAFASLAATPSPATREYQIKAAFLYQFLSFVKFPDRAGAKDNSKVLICIVGKDPFGDTIDEAFSKRTVQGRSIEIHRHETIKEIDEDAQQSHIVFFSSSLSAPDVAALLERLRPHPCLTVGESVAFCRNSGMISLRVEDNRIRFDANPTAAAQAGIKFSSQLLKLASQIVSTTEPEPAPSSAQPAGRNP